MKLKIIAVQMDLARQLETIEFIKQFCGFIAKNGYNTLVLYLEGRIRTKSFPYPLESESYSVDEMKDIVEYATGLGLDVIPVVSTLGHAELFLQYAELTHLAELRDGSEGRFHNSREKRVFCPSMSETYAFFEAYLVELADIFPSPYFHVGCDESWDVGCCELCRQRLSAGETQADLFAAHMIKSHEIVTGKLGKRMIMWDDMFEQYPEALALIPKDIVMCAWNYSSAPDLPVGHFNNGVKNDPFKYYSENGFDYIFAPCALLPNIELFTRYAQGHAPLGGLFAVFARTTSFMFSIFPSIAYAGRVWECGEKVEFADVVKDLFAVSNPEFVNAVETVFSGIRFKSKGSTVEACMGYPEYGDDRCGKDVAVLLSGVLSRYVEQVQTDVGKNVIEDICTSLEHTPIQYEFENVVSNADPKNIEKQLKTIGGKFDALAKKRIDLWNRWRGGITPCNIKSQYSQIAENLNKISKDYNLDDFLQLYFFLPDQYGAPACSIYVKYTDSDDFEPLASGSYKSSDLQCPFYSKKIRISRDRKPEAVKLEICGYGGQGFCYLKLQNQTGLYVPNSVAETFGEVSHDEYMLDYDRKWCFAGTQDIQQAVVNPELANDKHGFVLTVVDGQRGV